MQLCASGRPAPAKVISLTEAGQSPSLRGGIGIVLLNLPLRRDYLGISRQRRIDPDGDVRLFQRSSQPSFELCNTV